MLLQNVVVVDTTAVASLFAAVVAAKLSVVAVVVATLSAVAVVVATLFAVAVVVATPSVVAVVDTASLVVAVVATEFAVAALVVGIEIVVLAVAFVEKLELVDNWEVPDLLEIGRSSMGSGTVVVVAWEDLWTWVEHLVETGLLHEEGEGHCPTVFDL